MPEDAPNEFPLLASELPWAEVPSLQPTLRWQAFPDAEQRARIRDASGFEIGDVRYELRIWSVRGDARDTLAYERRELPEPAHRLEQPLLPRHRYFWSMRACFSIGEATACTPWAFSLVPARGSHRCESSEIPDWNFYRFQTR